MVMLVSLIFNLLFFVLFSYQVVTKQRCMLGHKWSRWTEWAKWSKTTGLVMWKQERVCKRCFKPDDRQIGAHICHGRPEDCTHREQYLSLIDSKTNIKALEHELGI